LAVVNELEKYDHSIEILYIGSKEGLESKIVPQTGIDYRAISCGKFRRYHQNNLLNIFDPTTLFKNSKDLINYRKGVIEAKKIIEEFDPEVVFTKGGYVSLPVGKAAISLGYPLAIHESDSVIGLSNRLLAKKADKICVAYPIENYKKEHLENLIYTGNPIREDIYGGDKERGVEEFKLEKDLPTIMIIGGSQGALIINQIISDSLTDLLKKYQLIHVAGERDYDWLTYKSQQLDKSLTKNYHLFNFLSSSLKDAYAASDLVISRAGNNVIAELAALSKPTILIPLSTSANDHQSVNAQILSQSGAAVLMLQEHLSPQKLSRQIDILFERPDELESMAKSIEKFAKKDAAEVVAKEIISLAKEYQKNEIKNEE